MPRRTFTQPLIDSRRLVDEAKRSTHGRVEVRDTNSQLILRVSAQGARSFIVRPRLNERPVRLTYDGLAIWENYKDAKTWAEEAIELCRRGIDPREAAKEQAEALERLKVSAVADEFLERHAKQNRSWKDTRGILRLYVKPAWGEKLMTEVTKEDIAALLEEVQARSSAYRRNRVLACVRKMFNWALANYSELTLSPVVKGMAARGEKKRTRYLEPEEIRLVWRAAERVGYPFGSLVQLLLATGQRRGEALGLRRGENLDLHTERLWTLTPEETKAERAHWVPLSELAIEVLVGCPEVGEEDDPGWMFTTTGKLPISGLSKMKQHLDRTVLAILREDAEAKGLDPDEVKPLPEWRLHDLRRTAATYLEETLAFAPHEVGVLVLNHDAKAYKGITATYTQGRHMLKRRRL